MSATAYTYDQEQQHWFYYQQPVDVLVAHRSDDVVALLKAVEQRCQTTGLIAVGFVGYEAATAFDAKLRVQTGGSLPLAWFAMFAEREAIDELPVTPNETSLAWQMAESKAAYLAHVDALQRHIGAGDIYQVNYTTRFSADGEVDLSDFKRMAVGAPYATFIETEAFSIASASPELFFSRRGSRLISKPMKGTAPRGLGSGDDQRKSQWLVTSEKNRAENLMITDMVRNDMGRIANTGSVAVPQLFEVEQYPTVWQMTSTVAAQSDADLAETFAALFPAASITGAPKRASMGFIAEHESAPRQIYTGAIGVVQPNGDACFNVAIRTAWTDRRKQRAYYAAGGGIVWDSKPLEEYAELHMKTALLTEPADNVSLLETMRWQPGLGIYLLDVHLKRLQQSAAYYAIPSDLVAINAQLEQLSSQLQLAEESSQRIRLCLHADGSLELTSVPLVLNDDVQPLALAATAVQANQTRLYHKTTDRRIYQAAQASVPATHEALLYNDAGNITESALANLVYQWHGQLYTPPLSDGLLPGTLRQVMLDNKEISERSLRLADIDQVEAWYLVNALRGRRRAKLDVQEANANAGGWR